MSKNQSEIKLQITLNDQNIPEQIDWMATDNPNSGSTCKAFLLSLFEKDSRDTLKIDLWTEDMQVVEMDRFIFHTLRSIADTYQKATNNLTLANEMQKFAQYFGEKTEILKKP